MVWFGPYPKLPWGFFAERAKRCGIIHFIEAQRTWALVASGSLTIIYWPNGSYVIPP